ncbi:conserved hypothetical protein [Desulfatibacillum aliphaticivorans]|uniref:Lipoprotein n=1 Tax=Desulfatibacillum aliphaticivorans TaxID=218208 RepID=B8FMG2_DESAL|nr:hypothetical protein [Desulfatibacillum aliphaticivorans]ACL06000.1 conserved hypothetical protein [Desulfatibacillum aliphaticivorans]
MKKPCLLFCLILAMGVLGCARPELHSKWLDGSLAIDGRDDDWRECLLYYDEDSRIMVGAYNNDQYLYVRVSSRNRNFAQQAMRSGLALWFDLDGGEDQEFGVRYPVGAMGVRRGMRGGPEGGMDRMPGAMERPRNDDLGSREPQPFMPGEVQILGPEEDQERLLEVEDADALEDIRVCIGRTCDLFVYEARISLQHLGGGDIEGPLGMGVLTSTQGGGMGGGPPGALSAMGGGPGGSGGGRGGGPGGGKGGPGMFSQKNTELWFKIYLAKAAQ